MQKTDKKDDTKLFDSDNVLIAKIETYISNDWHDSYADGSFMTADIVDVKIIEPTKYKGCEFSILDSDAFFRNKKLTKKGTKVKLTLYNIIPLTEVIEKGDFLPVKDVSPYDSDK